MTPRTLAFALALGFGCSKPAPTEPTGPQPTAPAATLAKAPDGSFIQAAGTKVALADVLKQHAQTVVVFYRGFF